MKPHAKEDFDYFRSLQESCHTCVIEYIIKEFYKPSEKPLEFDYRSTYQEGILVLCVLVEIPVLSKLVIYYQHKQWQYIRYDWEAEQWISKECVFLDLRDCTDIFGSKKERMRFIRNVWNCHLEWLI